MSGDNQIGWCVMAPDKTVFLDERYAYLDNARLAAERMRRRYGAGYRVVEVVWREAAPSEDPREVVDPAPAPAHLLCLSCGRHPAEHLTYTDHRGDRWHDLYGSVQCGPCVPAGAAP